MDLARWGVTVYINKRAVNVHSWSTMGAVVRSGVAVVCEDAVAIELA
jgi:hypothetical protein